MSTATAVATMARTVDRSASHGKLVVKTVVGRAVPLFPHVMAVREAVHRARSGSVQCAREQEGKDDTAVHVLLYLDQADKSADTPAAAAVQRLQNSVGLPLRMTITPSSSTPSARAAMTRVEGHARRTPLDSGAPSARIPIATLRLRFCHGVSDSLSLPRQTSCADCACVVSAYRTHETMQALLVATERLAQTLFHSRHLLLCARAEDKSLYEAAGYHVITPARDELAEDAVYMLKELGQHDALFSARL